MPRKSPITSEKNEESTKFQTNIKNWIDITQQIINLEKQLEVLREQQMKISHECVNQTSNLSQEIKINTLLSKKEQNEPVDNPSEPEENVEQPPVKKVVRRKRRTKAEIEQDRQAALAAKQAQKTNSKDNSTTPKKTPANKSTENKNEQTKKESPPVKPADVLEENSEGVSSSDESMSSSESSTELDSLSSDSSSSESSNSEDEN